MEITAAIERMTRRFELRTKLDQSDREALAALPFRIKPFEANQYLVREGSLPDESSFILSGLVFRQKLTADGDRQIVSLHVPGDFVDLEGALLMIADHNLQALTRGEMAVVGSKHIISLIDKHPRLGRAMWIDTLVDASIYREWVMNVGRRPARQRIAHILCEFARRLELAELGNTNGYEFPMTQEQLADAAGLTPVHVNRTLKQLEADGFIIRNKRFLHILDWVKLRQLSGFNELYLHRELST